MNQELALNLLAALSIGFLGSSHCLVMCGGIASALQLSMPQLSLLQQLKLQLMLSLGRLTTYCLLGALTGAFGAAVLVKLGISFLVKVGCRHFAVTYGMLRCPDLVCADCAGKTGGSLVAKHTTCCQSSTAFGQQCQSNSLWSVLGLLPCGLVYSSLGWSLASGSAWQGALLMCAFGIGTLPAMLALGGFAKQLSQFKNKNWVRASAAVLLALYALYTIAIALAPRFF